MSLHALIETQTEALNQLDSFLLLRSATEKVKELMSGSGGDVQVTRRILKKELLNLEKSIDKREGLELLGCRLMTLSNDLVLKARERLLGMVFSVLARSPRIEPQAPLLLALAKVIDRRLREAFRKQKERMEMHRSIYSTSWRGNPAHRKLLSVLTLQTIVSTVQGKTRAEVISTLKLCLCKYRKLRKLGHFLVLRRYFWTIFTQPVVVSTLRNIGPIADSCKKLITERLRFTWEVMKSRPEVRSPRKLEVLRTAMISVLKQTAFSTGPYSIINSKVVNSKSLYQWAEMQLARTIAEIKIRNLNSGFQALQRSFKKERRIRFTLEKRLWAFHTHLRNEIQLILAHWWEQVYTVKSYEALITHKRYVSLRKICRDKSKSLAFQKWKRYTKSLSSGLLKTVEIGVNKLIRYQRRVQQVSFSQIKRKSAFLKSRLSLAASALNIALRKILDKCQVLSLKQLQTVVRKRKEMEAGLISLALQVSGKRKLLKAVVITKLKSVVLDKITQDDTHRNMKLLSAIKMVKTLSMTRVKAMHHCWTKLALRLKYQENELQLILGFARLKNATELSAVEMKSKLQSALAVIKKNHRLSTNKTLTNWKRSTNSLRNKTQLGKVASPALLTKLKRIYQDRLLQAWDRLKATHHRFQMGKQLVKKLSSVATAVQLRRTMSNFSDFIRDIKREGFKRRSCMAMLIFSIRKWKMLGIAHWTEVTKNRQRLKQKQVKGLARLNRWLQVKVLPVEYDLFAHLKASNCLDGLRKLRTALSAIIRPSIVAGWSQLQASNHRVDSSHVKRKLAVLALLNIGKVLKTRCLSVTFCFWKNIQVNYRTKLQALALMLRTLSTHFKLQSQQVISAMKRLQYHRICIWERGRKRYRLLALSEREGQVYSALNKLVEIVDQGRRAVERNALVQVQHLCSIKTRHSDSYRLQRSLTARLVKRKGVNSVRIAFTLWCKEVRKCASEQLQQKFSHRVAFSTLDLYRRRTLCFSFWSRLKSATLQSYWQRKQVLTQLSEVLKTLRISHMQTAFT